VGATRSDSQGRVSPDRVDRYVVRAASDLRDLITTQGVAGSAIDRTLRAAVRHGVFLAGGSIDDSPGTRLVSDLGPNEAAKIRSALARPNADRDEIAREHGLTRARLDKIAPEDAFLRKMRGGAAW